MLRSSLRRLRSPRLLRFAAVGLSGVVVNLGLLFLLADVLRLDGPLAAACDRAAGALGLEGEGIEARLGSLRDYHVLTSALAIELSILWNFLLNDAWTFRDRNAGARVGFARRMVRYNLVSLVGLLVQLGVFVSLGRMVVAALDLPGPGPWKYPAQLAGIAAAMAWNFVSNFHFTWAQARARAAAPAPAPAGREALDAEDP